MKTAIAAVAWIVWLTATTAIAQTPQRLPADSPPPAEATPATTDAAAAAEDDKPYHIDPASPVTRCALKAYLRCLKLDRAACETATRRAAELTNAEMDLEAARLPVEQTEGPFFQGVATGTFLRHMNGQTEGRFLGCLHKAR